jgi:hypothetical protein
MAAACGREVRGRAVPAVPVQPVDPREIGSVLAVTAQTEPALAITISRRETCHERARLSGLRWRTRSALEEPP